MLDKIYHKIKSFLKKRAISLFNEGVIELPILDRLIGSYFNIYFKILPIEKLNEHKSRVELKQPYVGDVYGPAEINIESKKLEKEFASLGYNVLDNCLVRGNSPLIIHEKKLLRQYYTSNHSDDRISFNDSFILDTNSKFGLVVGKENYVDSGIFLGGSWPSNWYHWLVEILPKVELLNQLEKSLKELPILLPTKLKGLKNHLEVLNLILPNSSLVFLDDSRWNLINRLIWLDSPVLSSPDFKGERNNFDPLDYNFDWTIMQSFKENVLKKITLKKDILTKKENRIFLARKQAKRKYNQEVVFKMFEKYNFEKVYFEDLSFNKQVNCIRKADFIVGPTGAAWANLLFCESNTKAIIWLPESAKFATTFTNLAALSNVKLIHYYFLDSTTDWREFMQKEEKTIINIEKLESILCEMLETT